MDKRVTFAVAGSGKTSRLVQNLDEETRFLIVTYTDANRENLRQKIIARFGYFPANVKLYTYFRFLHSFCYRPFLRSEKKTRGVTFGLPPLLPRFSLSQDRRYMTAGKRLYANRLAKLIEQSKLMPAVIARIEKYFDVFFVDEVQDFGGNDFNFLMEISAAKVQCDFVGDFFQHTYDTSRDGPVNARLHDDYVEYQARFKKAKISVDTTSLKVSHRCSKSVCDFITEKIGIAIEASNARESTVRYVDDPDAVRALYEDNSVVKLFYQEHHKFGCYSQNWGASKGMDRYGDVVVALNPGNVAAWKKGGFKDINPGTLNKLYVACSRARGNLTLIPESLLKTYKTG